jgi:hypothetical protein
MLHIILIEKVRNLELQLKQADERYQGGNFKFTGKMLLIRPSESEE